jgi:Major Facilitator Superfamily
MVPADQRADRAGRSGGCVPGRRREPGGTTRYDLPGARLSTAGLASLVYGFTKAVTDGWSSARTLTLIALGVVLLGAFVVVEPRSTSPLLPLRVVLERNRGGAYLGALLNIVGLFAMFIFVSYYMQEILGYSAAKAGVAFLPFALGVIVAASASTSLPPKVGPRVAISGGLLLAALGLLWLTRIGVHTSYWTHLFPQQIVMSLGLGLAFPTLSSTALRRVRDEDAGVASALVNTTQQVGPRWARACSTRSPPRRRPPTSPPTGPASAPRRWSTGSRSRSAWGRRSWASGPW